MRYSLYQHIDEGMTIFRLYMEAEHFIKGYEFVTNIEGISNDPGITRLFGKEITDIGGNYLLFPLNLSGIEVGDFGLIQQEEKFTRVQFQEDEDHILRGRWVIRRLSNGGILLWKPLPVIFTMPTKNISVNVENIDSIEQIEQQFSIFELESHGKEFKGIAMAEGVWTGQDWHTTLFSDKIIESINKQMSDNISEMLVDYDHDFVSNGVLKKVTLKNQRGITYIDVEGEGNLPIPLGSGLSLILKSKIKWDKNLNVFVLLEAEPKGVSILTKGSPACTICMIR